MARRLLAIHRGVVRAAMRRSGQLAWRVAFAASLLAIGVADGVVLGLTKAYFGSGYNGFALHGWGERAAFFALGAALDATFVAGAWGLVLGAARLMGARPLRAIAAATAVSVALPVAFDLAIHRLHRVLGDVLELDVLLNLAGGSWSSALGEAAQDLPPALMLVGCALAALAAGALIVARLERAAPSLAGASAPGGVRMATAFGAGFVVSAGLLVASAARAPAIEFGLALKPAGRLVAWIADAATDVDWDGYGALSRPRDPAPFDGAIYPYAVEVPGNGIDEDGWAGDLPLDFEAPQPVPPPTPGPWKRTPSVVLIFLESFRADVVGSRLDGKAVTPNLDQLAAAGDAGVAYAHTPVTWASRGSLLQGQVVATATGQTIVDDFVERGYEVAWFSGQDDRVARGGARLGTERAAHFYDARSDVALRTSRSAQPISLQVSWKTLASRVTSYLEHRAPTKPLLLYVNIVDTHFPYWHRELDDILGVGELPRAAIRPENRDLVWRAYLNAAANVDRAVGVIVSQAERHLPEAPLVLVTADHGQAFYEASFLGHGQALDDYQTQVPLVVRGFEIDAPSPTALSDLRGLLARRLSGEPLGLRSERPLLQWVGDVTRPRLIGLRGANSIEVLDLERGVPISATQEAAARSWQAARGQPDTEKRNGADPL